MKFRTLKNWGDKKKLEGLVFFAQLLEELLFDYSLDTYKPSAMNTSSLCLEAVDLINDIENDLIEKANLNHVVSELIFNLKKDEVAKSLLDTDPEVFTKILESESSTIQEKKIVTDLLYSQINHKAYKARNEELLIQAVSNGREKNRIRSLTRSYVTTLIGIGYSTRYLYPAVRKFFHWGSSQISETSDIAGFFNLVDGTDSKYQAVFKASKIFEETKSSSEAFGLNISKELESDLSEEAASKNFIVSDDSVYIVVKEFESKDVFSARAEAERRVEILSTLMNMFHHKEVLQWESSALLTNLNTKTSRLIKSNINPMLLCSDLRTDDAAQKLNKFINEFTLEESHSFQKFFRATELHSLSLKNDSPENQLLNLWVALETLAPSKLTKNKAKINNVIESILPFLSLDYLQMLINRLVMDFCLWNRGAFNSALNGVEGDDDAHKLLRVLLLDKYSGKKGALFSSLEDFHLLRNRAHYFSECLSSTGKISRLLQSHWSRVDWQIRRIYRARNQIVHAGHTPSYIDVLIKNIHDYLDVITNGIVKLASQGQKVNTVDQAFKYTEIKYLEYMSELTKEDVKVDEFNLDRLVFNKRI